MEEAPRAREGAITALVSSPSEDLQQHAGITRALCQSGGRCALHRA